MEEDYDLVKEFDAIVDELRKKAMVCLVIGFVAGIIVGITLSGL